MGKVTKLIFGFLNYNTIKRDCLKREICFFYWNMLSPHEDASKPHKDTLKRHKCIIEPYKFFISTHFHLNAVRFEASINKKKRGRPFETASLKEV